MAALRQRSTQLKALDPLFELVEPGRGNIKPRHDNKKPYCDRARRNYETKIPHYHRANYSPRIDIVQCPDIRE
jgi:hypothetical protein